MEQTTALDSRLKSYARIISQQIRQDEVDPSCWIDGEELARLRHLTNLDLLGDRTSTGRASGAYLQNLYSQCADQSEHSTLRRAVNRYHLPNPDQVRRIIVETDRQFSWGLDQNQIAILSIAVVEVW